MANIITGIRLICALGLIFYPIFSDGFYILYILGGISDVLDGVVAGALGQETRFGACFDTIADIAFVGVALFKVMSSIIIPTPIIIWVILIAIIKVINIISGFIISGRFVAEHTFLNKVCGVLLFILPFVLVLISGKIIYILLVLLCILTTSASIQEGVNICHGREIS